jgi:hypothetical protein
MAEHSHRDDNAALARKLSSGGYSTCVIIGLTTGMSEAGDRRPTGAFADKGPWKEALVAFVKVFRHNVMQHSQESSRYAG